MKKTNTLSQTLLQHALLNYEQPKRLTHWHCKHAYCPFFSFCRISVNLGSYIVGGNILSSFFWFDISEALHISNASIVSCFSFDFAVHSCNATRYIASKFGQSFLGVRFQFVFVQGKLCSCSIPLFEVEPEAPQFHSPTPSLWLCYHLRSIVICRCWCRCNNGGINSLLKGLVLNFQTHHLLPRD